MELGKAFSRWWHCACLKCVSGLPRPEKSLNYLKCIFVFDLVLQSCSDIKYWNRMQLFFYFIVLIDIVASVVGTCFVYCVSRCRLKFFFAFWGKVCSWFPKLIWSQMDWVWGSFSKLGLYSVTFDLNRLKCSQIVETYVSFDDINFFDN